MEQVQEMVPREGPWLASAAFSGHQGLDPLTLPPLSPPHSGAGMWGEGAVGHLAQGCMPGWAADSPGDTAPVLAMGPGEGGWGLHPTLSPLGGRFLLPPVVGVEGCPWGGAGSRLTWASEMLSGCWKKCESGQKCHHTHKGLEAGGSQGLVGMNQNEAGGRQGRKAWGLLG